MAGRNGRGGRRRPVLHVAATATFAAVAAIVGLVALVPMVAAHGGKATLQLAVGQVNPGGTLDVRGDLLGEGHVEMRLVAIAGGASILIGTAEADAEGHFQAFLTVPSDLPAGSYAVQALAGIDKASAPIVIAGPALSDGEQGQQPGQEEGLVAPVATAPPIDRQPLERLATATTVPASPIEIAVELLIGLIAAVALGTFVRRRSALPRNQGDRPVAAGRTTAPDDDLP